METVTWEVAKTKQHDRSGVFYPEYFDWYQAPNGVYYPKKN